MIRKLFTMIVGLSLCMAIPAVAQEATAIDELSVAKQVLTQEITAARDQLHTLEQKVNRSENTCRTMAENFTAAEQRLSLERMNLERAEHLHSEAVTDAGKEAFLNALERAKERVASAEVDLQRIANQAIELASWQNGTTLTLQEQKEELNRLQQDMDSLDRDLAAAGARVELARDEYVYPPTVQERIQERRRETISSHTFRKVNGSLDGGKAILACQSATDDNTWPPAATETTPLPWEQEANGG